MGEDRRLGPGMVGGACSGLSVVHPTPPSPEVCFSVLLLLSQSQVETSPASRSHPQPLSWWSGGRKFGELPQPAFSPLPRALGVSHLWAQGRPGSGLTHTGTDASVGGPRQSGCLALGPCPHMSLGRGPGPVHHYSPVSCVTDSPRVGSHTSRSWGQPRPPQGSRRERLGPGVPPPPVSPLVSSTLSRDSALGGGGKATYPTAIPMECALTGMRQAGHPRRAPTGRGAGSTWGPGTLLEVVS